MSGGRWSFVSGQQCLPECSAGFITNVLKNPFYCGRLCYNRRTNSEKIRKNPKTAICIQGKHQAVISEDIWDQAEAKRIESPGKNENITDPERISLLSGLVKCPACGNGMVAMKNRKINRNHGGHYKAIYYYACRYHRKSEGRICSFRHTYNQEKKQGDRPVELVMPPMDKQAKWDMERCARFVLDMLIKYGTAIQAEKENKAHQQM